jgi:hypothetical protein
LAAGVAAAASVTAALIVTLSGPGLQPPPGPAPSPDGTPLVAITSWSQTTLSSPPREQYTFRGIARNLPPGSMIYVIAQSAHPGLVDGIYNAWLVSDQADLSRDGTWHVTWTLTDPPASARWTPVVWVNDCGARDACGEGGVPQLRQSGARGVPIVGRTVGGT